MLEASGISAFYGKHRALDGVSLTVARAEIVVILGANGAGKTTLLNVLAGVVPTAPGAKIVITKGELAGRDLAAEFRTGGGGGGDRRGLPRPGRD